MQGLTQVKQCEIEKLITDNTILCLTETQQKYMKVNISENLKFIDSTRDEADKKGGGLCIMHRKNNSLVTEEIKTKHSDILLVKCALKTFSFIILLVYMSTNDQARNKIIEKEINAILEKNEEKPFLFLGDFNGHTGFLGTQDVNINGERVLNWIENKNLILLNGDPNCSGEITWESRDMKSAIDFIMMNQELYNRFMYMNIDEQKEKYDLSDHNVLSVLMQLSIEKCKYSNKVEEITYMKITEDTLEKYLLELESELRTSTVNDIETFEKLIKSISEKHMKRKIRRKTVQGKTVEVEPIWMTREIKMAMSKRRTYNKEKRKLQNTSEEYKRYDSLYREQKIIVKNMIKDAMWKHEKKVTDDIRRDRNMTRKLWEHIKRLKGENLRESKKITLYGDNEMPIKSEDIPNELICFWNTIYRQRENTIKDVWNEDSRRTYEQTLRKEREEGKHNLIVGEKWESNDSDFPVTLREHLDMAYHCNIPTPQAMDKDKTKITKEEVKKQLEKTKKGKASGPDKLKPDLFKVLNRSEICTNKLVECFNNIINEEHVTESWKETNTTLIPKKTKPTVTDLRPIALANSSYKIFMGIVRQKIEDHIKESGLRSDLQAGFTEDRRVTDNLYILKYCIYETFKNKNTLIVTSLDFKKAFDSINRENLIKTLMKNKIDSSLISIIAQIYSDDRTRLHINNEEQATIHITNGVRQGCNGSTVLFLLMTYEIIQKLEEERIGFRNGKFKIPILYYADDGLLLSRTIEEARYSIDLIENIAMQCGLQINKEKSNILMYNQREQLDTIANIKICNKIKYLGITIENKKNCFREHKKEKLNKAKQLANMTYSITERSCNRLLVGKGYWKGVGLAATLYGAEILDYNKEELEKLQRIENKVYRCILRVPTYTANCVLRSEVGATSTVARDGKIKILFAKHILKESRNELMREIFLEEYEKGQTTWIKTLKAYMLNMNLTLRDIKNVKKESIIMKIKEWDTARWRREAEEKSTLSIYRIHKNNIKEESWIDNTEETTLMTRARTNTLSLNWRNRYQGKSEVCPYNDSDKETLEHFVLECRGYESIRRKFNILSSNENENKEELLAQILLFNVSNNKEMQEKKEYIKEIWKARYKKEKEEQRN